MSTEVKQILLIMDNHNSHVIIEANEIAKKNHKAMLGIPSHSIYRSQLSDVIFLIHVSIYRKECDMYMKSKHMIKITLYEIFTIFDKVYSKEASLVKGLCTFRTIEIVFMDPCVFFR